MRRLTVEAYCVYIVLSPATKAVEDRPSGCLERLGHLVEAVEGDDGCAETAHVVAIVVFEIVDTPGSKALCILCFVVKRSSISCASHFASTRVHAKQQILIMQFVGNSEHAIREFRFVDYEVAVVATSARPAIIKDDVIAAEIPETVVDQKLRSLEEQVLGYIAGECVPVVLS